MSMVKTYERYVAEDCDDLLSTILGYYTAPDTDPGAIFESVMLHHYVYHELAYWPRDHETEALQTVRQTWDRHGGNCEEKSLLLCSLLRQLPGQRTHFVTVDNGEEGHALLEINYTGLDTDLDDPDGIANYLRAAYEEIEELDLAAPKIHWEVTGGDYWFVIDPVKSRYVGDLSTHLEEGYAVRTEDGWEWNRIKDKGIHYLD